MNTQFVLSELERVASLARDRSLVSHPDVTGAFSRRRGAYQEDGPTDVPTFIEKTHSKVIAHYRRLLTNADLTSEERADLEARVARELNWSGKTVNGFAA